MDRAVDIGNRTYVSMSNRPRSASRAMSRRRESTRVEIGDERVEDAIEREVVAVLAPRVALVLVGEAVRLPRHREAQLVPVVARDVGAVARRARPTCGRRRSRASCPAAGAGGRRPQRRRCARRRGTPCRCRAPSRCCSAPRACAAAARGPSGQYASSPPSQSWNHAMPVAIGMRYASNRPECCITTSSHCGTSLRLAPRNSGTSVCTASSWPGTMRFAYAIAGSMTGRPWIVARRLDERRVVQERLDAVDRASRCRTRTPRGSSSCAPRARRPVRRRRARPPVRRKFESASWRCASPRPMSVSMLLVLEVHAVAPEPLAEVDHRGRGGTCRTADRRRRSCSSSRTISALSAALAVAFVAHQLVEALPLARGSSAVSGRAPRRPTPCSRATPPASARRCARRTARRCSARPSAGSRPRRRASPWVSLLRFEAGSCLHAGRRVACEPRVASVVMTELLLPKSVAQWQALGTYFDVDGNADVRRSTCRPVYDEGKDPMFVLHGYPSCCYDWHRRARRLRAEPPGRAVRLPRIRPLRQARPSLQHRVLRRRKPSGSRRSSGSNRSCSSPTTSATRSAANCSHATSTASSPSRCRSACSPTAASTSIWRSSAPASSCSSASTTRPSTSPAMGLDPKDGFKNGLGNTFSPAHPATG